MENSGDQTRALLLTLIMLMIQIDSGAVQSESDTECPTTPSLPECANDCNESLWFNDMDKGSCQECPKCGPGQGLDRHCGGRDGHNARCEPCVPGRTFSNPNDYWCHPCQLCDNTVGDSTCNATSDTVCGKCQTGYYHEKGKPSLCHPCTFLSKQELEPQCQQKLTSNQPQTSPPQETNNCPTTPSLPECANDCNESLWFNDMDKGSCQECPKCGPGQGLDRHCGGRDGHNARCEPCVPGRTFSNPNDYWCHPCQLCDNTVGDSTCNTTSDTVCGKCQTGYYHEKGKPSLCHPCTFLLEPELEPQCQQKLTTDQPQTSPPQETNYVLPSPVSGDSADQLEEEAGESPGSDEGDLAEDEQVVDAAVPSSSNHVLYAILVICATVLIILTTTLIYKGLKKRIPHEATQRHGRQTDYAEVNLEEAPVVVDVEAQTARYSINQNAMVGEPSGNEEVLSHVGSAESVSGSSANLLGSSTLYSNPDPSRYLTSNAILPSDDERDVMISTPINTAAHSSTSCADGVKAASFEVLQMGRLDFQLGGEPLFFPEESSSGNNIISPGSLPGKASNVGTQHPSTEGSHPSMVTSAYPDGKGGAAENGIDIDEVSTCQAASTLVVADAAVSSAAAVADATAASLLSPSLADTHFDVALATMEDTSAAAVNAVTAGAIFPYEADGAAHLTEITKPSSGLINKDTGARPESNCSSPLTKSTTSKKRRKSKVRVTPSDLDSSNESKDNSASSSNKPCIHVFGSKNKVYYVGDNSNLNIGYNSTDTESDM